MVTEIQQEIEKFAWEIFLMKTGLSFKRELTPEEKQSIIDADPEQYQWYRDEALKKVEKRIERYNEQKDLPVIEVPASGEKGWVGGGYVLCFVYSKHNGNFILKGYYDEVKEYLKKNYTHYFYNMSFWYHGFNRDIWGFWKDSIGIFHPDKRDKRRGKKIEVRPYHHWTDDDELRELKLEHYMLFKRLPKRWIPEFDNF